MHKLINQLTQSHFKKNSLQECSLDELHDFAKQYPYYAVAQVLYTSRLKEINHDDFQKQLQKTSLYFNSPLWLQTLFTENTEENIYLKSEPLSEKIPYEDFNNDELVVANPRPEVFNDLPELKTNLSSKLASELNVTNESSLTFDPYHTVDYFASQGIKNQPEEKPTDKFGQQLKSFTEWLKTLKSAAAQENTAITDNNSEEIVVSLAQHSVEDRNVISEAMAEVWIKQGELQKALNIYNKLSLLNPSKSSYFASLIENLKKN